MSDKQSKSKPKQRLKGVENFLRRMAFNLGNSPSQTEVKIISCIPIDVTDLQKKIISLEKQLDDAKNTPTNAVAAAYLEYRPELSTEHNYTSYRECYDTNVPNQSAALFKRVCCEQAETSRYNSVHPTTSMINNKSITNKYNNDTKVLPNENKEGVFNDKVKKKNDLKKNDLKKNDNFKTQLVYYAQTASTPFNKHDIITKSGSKDISTKNYKGLKNRSYMQQMIWGGYEQKPILEEFTDESDFPLQRPRGIYNKNYSERDDSHSYFEHMIRRQYEPRPILNEFTNGSTISSPICRDNRQNHNDLPNEFDCCSCCQGAFRNIDNLNQRSDNLPLTNSFNENFSEQSIFYDSSLYDMIPVKEITTNWKKKGHPKSKHKKTGLNDVFASEAKAITKNRSLIINYHMLAPTKLKSPKISPIKVTNKIELDKIIPKRHVAATISVEPIERDTSKSCCIDFGNVYMKQRHKKRKPTKTVQTKKSLRFLKDTECMTTNILNTECQTVETQSIQIDDKKTEQTLDQIKSILQSVLTEVKTNAQQKILPQEKDTKDAVVQKGASRGNMPGCSDLLRSYTYSTCNMNLYSRQLNSSQYCSNLPYNPMKCTHNFPVFIQTPNRNMCLSCYRNTSSHFAKAGYPKPAITAATNTDDNKGHSIETEKLIKEIYKSITLNFDMPTKDTSMSENDDLQSYQRSISKSSNANKFSHSTGVSIKSMPHTNLARNTSMVTSVTPFSTTPLSVPSKQSNTVSMQSQAASTSDTERHLREDRNQPFVQNKKSRVTLRRVREEYEQPNENDVISEYTESSDEEMEQDTGAQQPKKRNKKKNIFTKMFKSVKLFKNKNKQKQPEHISETDEEEEDDSDYQTIYSQKIDRVRHLPMQTRGRKLPHSKISYSRQIRERCPEKRPYKDQEYRRQWAERVIHREERPKYSSERPRLKDISKIKEPQIYWQNYDTRNVMIERNEPPPHIDEDYTTGYMDSSSASKYVNVPIKPAARLTWLKKHKLGMHCGEQWKKLILEG